MIKAMKNLRVILPLLVAVLAIQFFLVRYYTSTSNERLESQLGPIDTSIPHPSDRYEAKEVIQVVLYALRFNHRPTPDSGLRALWQFFTPALKSTLRDRSLLKPFLGEDVFTALTDHQNYSIDGLDVRDNEATATVSVTSEKRLPVKLKLLLRKVEKVWLIEEVAPHKEPAP